MTKPARTASPAQTTGAISGSRDYIETLYQDWLQDPSVVGAQWNDFFRGFQFADGTSGSSPEEAHAQAQVASLIANYRTEGHLISELDPLGNNTDTHPDLDLSAYGLCEDDLDRVFDTGTLAGPERLTLRELLVVLERTYCRTIGVEYRHIQNRQIRRWLEEEMEPTQNTPDFSRDRKMEILKRLIDAEIFENFIHSRYPGQKRFSLEGAESLIPALHRLIQRAASEGVESIIMGMAHRGRLNVLANILDKPYALIFSEFEDVEAPESVAGDGDVKYHRGYFSEIETPDGPVAVSLAANPSHLEAVGPVVEGRARAKQRRLGDTTDRTRVLPVLMHGDAAFAGQGLVAETLNLSQLAGYRVGGTVHIIVNNQIGFTTAPCDARSTLYSTDVAKMVGAPIFHVNGDDPEAVVWVTELALRFRQRFHQDVVIDMICYRRHGHNEGDEPAYTQPLLYKKIKNRPSTRQLYIQHLVEKEDITERQGEKIVNGFKARLQKAFESVKEAPPKDTALPFDQYWEDLGAPFSHDPSLTSVSEELLVEVGKALTSVPDGFNLNPKVARRLPKLMEAITSGGNVDWPTAELLSFGTLLRQGTPVRLSGQDSARGTFSQRHSVWSDYENQDGFVPLNHIHPDQARFCVYNSLLSEAAVLGFDYGYSLGEPHMLVMWEAQFGDFANGAQVIIDQFLVSSQSKWNRTSGLVMLLPHGYEGQGPEHSNAYLERYLAAGAEQNIQVCNLSTPAQYFHVLRRQLSRNFRRPLVIMTPKSLLRHPECVSTVSSLTAAKFEEVLDDPTPPKSPNRLVLCSGKVYYDLLKTRREEAIADVGLIRVEQLYPLHEEKLTEVVGRYGDVSKIVWAQEEPRNRGAWTHILPRLTGLFPGREICYAGRSASASPATGSARVHHREQDHLVRSALGVLESVPG